MSAILLLSVLLLFLPHLLLPRRARPEIHGLLRVLWWLNRLYCGLVHRVEIETVAPLPEHGPAMLISNHTCGIDHMLLQAGAQRVLGFMVAREYYEFWAFRPFCLVIDCIPVNRDGRDLAATRAALRALEKGRVVPIFPEGRILPRSGREMGEGKPGVAFIALRAKVPVIPAYIRGTPETNDILKSLITPSNAKVVFGPPIDLSPYTNAEDRHEKANLDEVTERLMSAIRALRASALERETGKSPGE
jgi:1-acyl-sn-glycerol-3-phosphate acyltransferase